MTLELKKGLYFVADRETSIAIGKSDIPPREQQIRAVLLEQGEEAARKLEEDLRNFDQKLDNASRQSTSGK